MPFNYCYYFVVTVISNDSKHIYGVFHMLLF